MIPDKYQALRVIINRLMARRAVLDDEIAELNALIELIKKMEPKLRKPI